MSEKEIFQDGVLTLHDTLSLALDLQKGGDSVNKIKTGFEDLDTAMGGGFQRGGLYTITARPGMGKHILAMTLALNISKAFKQDEKGNTINGGRVLYTDWESDHADVGRMILSMETKICGYRMARKKISAREISRMVEVGKMLSKIPLMVDTKTETSMKKFRDHIIETKNKYGLDVMIVSYSLLSFFLGDGDENPNLKSNKSLAHELKLLAQDLNICIVVLYHLPCSVEDDFRPTESDFCPFFGLRHLRKAGDITSFSDVVMILHRDQYYLETICPERIDGESDKDFDQRLEYHQKCLEERRDRTQIFFVKNYLGSDGSRFVNLYHNFYELEFKDIRHLGHDYMNSKCPPERCEPSDPRYDPEKDNEMVVEFKQFFPDARVDKFMPIK